jgi:hypothetical protein
MQFDDELVERLILDGIVEFAGLDKNNQMLYSFSDDIKDKAPGLYEVMIDYRMRDVRDLWALGFLSMNIDEPNPLVRITEKALDEAEIAKLDDDLALCLNDIKSAMLKRDEEWNT